MLRKISIYNMAILAISQLCDRRAIPMMKPSTVAKNIPRNDTSKVFSRPTKKVRP